MQVHTIDYLRACIHAFSDPYITTCYHHYTRDGNDYLGAFNRVPRHLRLIFIHAYQSYIWNKAVTRHIQAHGLSCVEGDLVWLGNHSPEELAQDSEIREEVARTGGDRASTGVDNSKIKALTAEDIAAGTYSIENLVIPLVGTKTILPVNDTGTYLNALLQEDGLSLEEFANAPPTYRLQGAYRHVIIRPGKFEYDLVQYSDPNAELAETELRALRKNKSCNISDATPGKDLLAVRLKFMLHAGSYATMLLRELTKQATDTMFQSTLTANSGGCGKALGSIKKRGEDMIAGDTDNEEGKNKRTRVEEQ